MQPAAPPLQALLFRQVCALGWLAGLFHPLYPHPALLAAGIILLADGRLFGPRPNPPDAFPAGAADSFSRRCGRALFFLGCFILGSFAARAAAPDFPPPPHWLDEAQKANRIVRVRGVVTQARGLPDARLRITLRGLHPVDDPAAAALPGFMDLTWERPFRRPLPGQSMEASLRIRDMRGLSNPELPDLEEQRRLRGIFQRASLREGRGDVSIEGEAETGARLRETLRARLIALLSEKEADGRLVMRPGAGMIPALLFGDRFFLDSVFMDRMAAATLVHSIALSGQHLAVAGFFALLLAGLAGRVAPELFLHLPRRKFTLLAALPPATVYLWLGDAPPSLLRAAIMLGFFAFLLLRDKAYTLIDALFAAVLCITVLSPLSVHDMGLQLSVLSVGAIALSVPVLERLPRARGAVKSRLRGGLGILCVSASVQIALLPLLLIFFGNPGCWFFLNVFWLPVLGCVVLPLSFIGIIPLALGAPDAALPFFRAAIFPCDALAAALDFLAAHGFLDFPAVLRPHWTALPAFAALAVSLAMIPGRSRLPPAGRRLLAAGALLLLAGPLLRHPDAAGSEIRLKLIDVGHGQAILIEAPGGTRTLVDGGSLSFHPRFDVGRNVLAPVLSANRSPHLELVVNSHPDRDHLHGLFFLLKYFRVDRFAHSGDVSHKSAAGLAALLDERNLPESVLRAGQSIRLASDLRLEVLHPPSGFKGSSNNKSLVLRLLWNEIPLALIPGDAEKPALKRLLASGANLRAPVLILPHHGGKTGFCPEFYDAVRPCVALASNGRSPRYPAEEVRKALAERGVKLIESAEAGQIRIVWDTEGMMKEVSTGRMK
jgi:competence protein ComEC